MAKATAGCKTVVFWCLVCFTITQEGFVCFFILQINSLLAIIKYTYSNLRILNAHVSAEGSCKLFRITIEVVQVLEFNEFRHLHADPTEEIAANQK